MLCERPHHCRMPLILSTSSSSLAVVHIGVILEDLTLLKTDALLPVRSFFFQVFVIISETHCGAGEIELDGSIVASEGEMAGREDWAQAEAW